jgi:AraC-like DNA-binding protein
VRQKKVINLNVLDEESSTKKEFEHRLVIQNLLDASPSRRKLLRTLSRSAFAMRFKVLIGEAPLEYLTRWRMYKAGRLLRDDSRKLFEVASSVGYDSDGAFHKAFKRVIGVTPGECRRTGSREIRA